MAIQKFTYCSELSEITTNSLIKVLKFNAESYCWRGPRDLIKINLIS